MKRKVVRHGTATLTISLPRKWVTQQDIVAGDELEVSPTEDSLIILSQKKPTLRQVELAFSSENEWGISKILVNLYRTGYDQIIIRYEKPESFLRIKRALSGFVGFEITDQSARTCTIKNISPQISLDFQSTFRKCFHLIGQEWGLLVTSSKSPIPEGAEMMAHLDLDVKKFTLLCQRLLHTNSEQREFASSYFRILSKLLKTSRNCNDIYSIICRRKPGKETLSYVLNAQKLFHDSSSSFFQGKITELHRLNTRKKELYDKFLVRIQHYADADNLVYLYVSDNIKLTCTFSFLPILVGKESRLKSEMSGGHAV